MSAKRIILGLVLIIVSCSAAMADSYLYDFSTATGSDLLDKNINGNDNWEYLAGDGGYVYRPAGQDNTLYQANSASTACQVWRQNDAVFSYTLGATDTGVVLSFKVRARNTANSLFALGYDDGSSVIVGPQFGLNSTNWNIRGAAFGTNTFVANSLTTDTKIYELQMVVDFTANGGDGSGSMYIQNLTDGGDMVAVDGLQNINLELGRMGISNPSDVNGLYVRLAGGGAWVDNLMITPVPEPTTMILLGMGGLLGLARRRRK
jgi:hypothetical protein